MTQPAPPPLDAAGQARLRTLSEELRCLVCQNQTLADSHADLAIDLRNQVQELIAAGKANAEIKQYLVERYGDFVLYRPPVQGNTMLLWGGPFALLAGGGLIWAIVQRRSRLAARGGGTKGAAKDPGTSSSVPGENRSAERRPAAAPAGASTPETPVDMGIGSRGVAGTAVAGSVVAGSAMPGAARAPGATGMVPIPKFPPQKPAATGLERARRLLDD